MKRVVASMVVLTSFTGCANYRQSRTVASVGGVTTAAGVAAMVWGLNTCDSIDCPSLGVGALILFPIGAIAAVSGLVGMVAYDSRIPEVKAADQQAERARAENQRARESEVDAERRTEREHVEARTLRSTAFRAARAGDCSTVQMLARRIELLDHDYYVAEVGNDAAFKPCLDAAPTAAPIAPAP